MTKNFMISAKKISKAYRLGGVVENVFTDLHLDIQRGEFLAITGPSGSGKSTLLNLLGLMDYPSSGELIFDGKSIEKCEEAEIDKIRRVKLGFIFQNFNLFSALTALENVKFSIFDRGVLETDMEEAALSALHQVGMKEHASKLPHQLSGGQRQRVAIARAFVHQPELIIADEPTASLDRKNAEDIVQVLKRLHREQKTTIILASHDPDMYEEAERILRLEGGKIVNSSKN